MISPRFIIASRCFPLFISGMDKSFNKPINSDGICRYDIKTEKGNSYPNQILCKHWHLLQDIADVFKVNIHYAKFLSFVKTVAFLSRSLAPRFLLSQGNTADSHA